jgi:hypothetical protein
MWVFILWYTDNQEFKLGNVTIKVLHTPGTRWNLPVLYSCQNGKELHFCGITLFIGDVEDQFSSSDLTIEDLAGHLYDSFVTKRACQMTLTVYQLTGRDQR